ncbi:DUF447 domain-containing protein [Halovivax sp.]|uniref:DUF447 domain-containing protein n=1 Tax=Halovivax sp. TaxID=1935978 RepID=UPI0025BDD0C3|nr:DUF447 domain-containing protein [Halovivax sp.]
MSGEDGERDDAPAPVEWPVELAGVTESLVATLGPNDRWNVAPLGLFAGDPVTATTWGNTRTRRNFARRGGGYVQFARDPVDFVDAALSIVELDDPILDSADAWVRVDASSVAEGSEDGTSWERWALRPVEETVRRERVPTIDRGFAAVVEGTIAVSRLGVPGYDDRDLRDRLEWCASIVDRAGGPREREAFARLCSHAELDLAAARENEWL